MARSDARWFLLVGAGLLALAATFLWIDLKLPLELLPTVAAAGAVALSLSGRPRAAPWLGAAALFACVVGGAAWYAVTLDDALLVALGLAIAGAIVVSVFALGGAAEREEVARVRWTWASLVASALAASWGFYYRFLTLGVAESFVARRLVLTLVWLTTGLVLVVAQRRPRAEPRWAGYAFLGAALAKAVGYDTTHLDGGLRVAVLAAAGGLFLAGAWLSARARAETA